jgi:ionotropic kainate glutamate receptor 2
MTITLARAQVIDLTKPFLNLGISILYKRPELKPPKLFSFMAPLSVQVWYYMLASYFGKFVFF